MLLRFACACVQKIFEKSTMLLSLLLLIQVGFQTEISLVSGQKSSNMISLYNALRSGGLFDDRKPYFDNTRPTKVTAQVGSTAQLSCKVLNLYNHTVSWIRHKDLQILTVGPYAYTNDDRYVSIYRPHYEDFQLHIKFVRPKDAGVYECQISTEPVSAYHIHLQVIGPPAQASSLIGYEDSRKKSQGRGDAVEHFATSEYFGAPSAVIINGDDVYVAEGSMINLTCIITQSRVEHVFWYHKEKVISYYSRRGGLGGVSVVTEKSDFSLTSYLLIRDANADDQGTYTCSLSNANVEAKCRVFVLKDIEMRPEQNSAVISSNAGKSQSSLFQLTFVFCIILYSSLFGKEKLIL